MLNYSKTIVTSYLLILFSFSFSQTNLVPNPSFESYSVCPNSAGFIPVNWDTYKGSPDYYNICAVGNSTPSVGVPSNWAGYQSAFQGNAYVGIATFIKNGTPDREFLGTQLIQTLNIGTKYFVSAFISRQDTSNTWVGYACASNKFGFKFSTTAFSYTLPAPIDNSASVFSNALIEDTLGWTKISGSFIADSSYKYVILGNFFDASNTNTTQCTNSLSVAYYFLDNVCVSTDSLLCNSVTSIKQNDYENNIKIYPNPVSQEISIDFALHNTTYDLILYNIFGNEVIYEKDNTGNKKFDLTFLEYGFFYIKIRFNNQELNYKLIKQ